MKDTSQYVYTLQLYAYLVETFRTELATSAAASTAPLFLSDPVFLCCTIRMPPAFTENVKKEKKTIIGWTSSIHRTAVTDS